MLWVSSKTTHSRELFKRPLLEPQINLNSVARHVKMKETKGSLCSSFDVKYTAQGQHQYHTLHGVRANGNQYVMKYIDLSAVVLSIFENPSTPPVFDKRRDAIVFDNLFLLLMAHPSRWFPKLFGTPPSQMDK